jgi:uncharacterized protein (DUF2236 family)
VFGPLPPAARERLHQESAIYATALQVQPWAWPADPAAFEEYWLAGLCRLEPIPQCSTSPGGCSPAAASRCWYDWCCRSSR